MSNIGPHISSDPSGELSARFLQDPENLYGLHGASMLPATDMSDAQRWLPPNSRRYASEEGLLPPIEPEIALIIGKKVGALYQAVTEHFRHSAQDLTPVTE